VLIATLILVAMVAAVSACLFQLDSSRARRQIASTDNKRAFNIAEAGISEGFYGLQIGKTGNVGSSTEPACFGDGLFWVTATDLGGNIVGLESTGMCGSGRVTLSLVVHCKPVSIASLGMLGANDVAIGTGATVDGYDSTGAELPQDSWRLQSNGDITVGDGASVAGDAAPGPQSSVMLGRGATVTGSTAPNSQPVELPLITVPKLASSGNIAGTLLIPRVIKGEIESYDKLTVGAATALEIVGPTTVIVGTLNVAALGSLRFDTTQGPITLYVTESIKLAAGANIGFSSKDPRGVSLLIPASKVIDRDGDGIPDQPVRISSTSTMYATLYAPESSVSLPSGFELFGTIAAKRLSLGANSKLHFDTALLAGKDEQASTVERLSWRVVEIPVEIARDFEPDPFAALDVVAVLLPKPIDAHSDPGFQISIEYVNSADVVVSYRGPEDSFDWGLVKSVNTVVRQLL